MLAVAVRPDAWVRWLGNGKATGKVIEGFIKVESGAPLQQSAVTLTPRGRAMLDGD